MLLDGPRGPRSPDEITRRLILLGEDNPTAPLRDWSLDLADRRAAVVPHFDPTDAGVEAKVMLLLEAPGPMTNASNVRPGSGFISVDNDDQTAENAWRARAAAGLSESTIHWNIVPWYLGPASKKPSAAELAQRAMELRSLLNLLPQLRVVVLCGNYARDGWNKHVAPLVGSGLTTVTTWHPSPLGINPGNRRNEFIDAIRRAASLL